MVESEITALLEAASNGDSHALQALFVRVYHELKQLARHRLAESAGHSLNTTALVHEVYLKLAHSDGRPLHGRTHFFALAAKAMRQIVIDRARARAAEKRGGGEMQLVELDEALDVSGSELDADELMRLNNALDSLEAVEPRLAELVELRFFAGLGIGEIAALRDVSERTLNRDWRRAKAQLYATLHPEP